MCLCQCQLFPRARRCSLCSCQWQLQKSKRTIMCKIWTFQTKLCSHQQRTEAKEFKKNKFEHWDLPMTHPTIFAEHWKSTNVHVLNRLMQYYLRVVFCARWLDQGKERLYPNYHVSQSLQSPWGWYPRMKINNKGLSHIQFQSRGNSNDLCCKGLGV